MAKITITIEDTPSAVAVQYESDPKLVVGELMTDAQRIGWTIYSSMEEVLGVPLEMKFKQERR